MLKLSISLGFSALIALSVCSCGEHGDKPSDVKTDSVRTAEAAPPKKNNDLIQPPDTDYTGDYIDRYKNGVIKFTGFFRFGKRHGQWMAFYLNGEKWSECFYEKGLKDGASNVYFPNGQPQFKGWYRNDLKDSIWTFYDTLGKVIDVKHYKRDVEVTKQNF